MGIHDILFIHVQARSSSGNHAGRISGNSGRQPSQAWGQNRQRRGTDKFALNLDMQALKSDLFCLLTELIAAKVALVCRKNHGQTRLPACLEEVKAPSRNKQSQLHLVQAHSQQSMLPRQTR